MIKEAFLGFGKYIDQHRKVAVLTTGIVIASIPTYSFLTRGIQVDHPNGDQATLQLKGEDSNLQLVLKRNEGRAYVFCGDERYLGPSQYRQVTDAFVAGLHGINHTEEIGFISREKSNFCKAPDYIAVHLKR